MSTSDPLAPSLVYRVYSNGGGGGPVDYSSPIATTSDVTLQLGPLVASGRYAFGVRAFDPSTNIEESNTDVVTRVWLDETGADATDRPEVPRGVGLSAVAGGGYRVSWAYPPTGLPGRPQSFRIDLGTGQGVGSAVATVPWEVGRVGYAVTVAGPLARGVYWVEVRGVNARGIGPPSERVSAALGLATEPLAMDTVSVRVS